jgi:hypothetical protein
MQCEFPTSNSTIFLRTYNTFTYLLSQSNCYFVLHITLLEYGIGSSFFCVRLLLLLSTQLPWIEFNKYFSLDLHTVSAKRKLPSWEALVIGL